MQGSRSLVDARSESRRCLRATRLAPVAGAQGAAQLHTVNSELNTCRDCRKKGHAHPNPTRAHAPRCGGVPSEWAVCAGRRPRFRAGAPPRRATAPGRGTCIPRRQARGQRKPLDQQLPAATTCPQVTSRQQDYVLISSRKSWRSRPGACAARGHTGSGFERGTSCSRIWTTCR